MNISPEITGQGVRDHLINLQALMAPINELVDQSSDEVESLKIKIEEVEYLLSNAKQSVVRKNNRGVKEDIYKVVTLKDGTKFCKLDLNNLLVEAKNKLSRRKSKYNELKSAISVYTMALSWDKMEVTEF